jgi:hypothetical protein
MLSSLSLSPPPPPPLHANKVNVQPAHCCWHYHVDLAILSSSCSTTLSSRNGEKAKRWERNCLLLTSICNYSVIPKIYKVLKASNLPPASPAQIFPPSPSLSDCNPLHLTRSNSDLSSTRERQAIPPTPFSQQNLMTQGLIRGKQTHKKKEKKEKRKKNKESRE